MAMGYGAPGPYGGPGMPGFGPAGPIPGMGHPQPGGYEFSQFDNATISTIGSRARMWGIISVILGGLVLASAVVVAAVSKGRPEVIGVAGAMTALALQPALSGYFYAKAGASLKAVAATQGNDIEHMMEGLAKLTAAIRVEGIVSVVAFLIGIGIGIYAASAG